MSDDQQLLLDKLEDIHSRLAEIEQALTGAYGKHGLVGDLVDHERRITAFEHERERHKGMMFVIGGLAGLLGTLVATFAKYFLTK